MDRRGAPRAPRVNAAIAHIARIWGSILTALRRRVWLAELDAREGDAISTDEREELTRFARPD
jgi:hypothetical protein